VDPFNAIFWNFNRRRACTEWKQDVLNEYNLEGFKWLKDGTTHVYQSLKLMELNHENNNRNFTLSSLMLLIFIYVLLLVASILICLIEAEYTPEFQRIIIILQILI